MDEHYRFLGETRIELGLEDRVLKWASVSNSWMRLEVDFEKLDSMSREAGDAILDAIKMMLESGYYTVEVTRVWRETTRW